ncbi:MAG: hypothetical protein IH947_03140 [Bacteroidetes bacterium]|nr:hypothetical protein [Bacteroidota bacterium]
MGGNPPRIPGQGLARGLVKWLNDPGDPKMRKLAVRVIEEVNEIKAKGKGVLLEAVGWEDSLPGWGRPQELINKDLKSCQLVKS